MTASLTLTLGVLLCLGLLIGLQGRAAAAPQRTANPLDVVINEAAWGGTAASSADEWIELYNNTDSAIVLTGWALLATDGTPNITLNGTIPAHGYFLLERTDDNTVSDIPADQIYTGDLGNGGETLQLKEGTTVIDSANGDGGSWPAGTASPTYKSMERINPAAADTDANWASNDGITRNGLDANGTPINGTPKARNSVTPVPAADLSIRKTGPASVQPGQEITYTIAFSNVGTLDAAGVVITDVLPTFVTYQRHTAGYPVSEPVSGTLVWTVGSVGVTSGTFSFQVVGLVDSGASGTLTNGVTVTTSTTETVTANNHDTWITSVGVPGTVNVLITALHYYGYDGYDDEGVRLMNLGTAPAGLSGWRLTDNPAGTGGAIFPAGTTLAPGQSMWCAKSAVTFTLEFGFKPSYETDATDPAVPEMSGSWPGFANDGDECALFDSGLHLMDMLVYGNSTNQTGWSGPALQPWAPSTAFAKEGQILYRKLDQATGRPVADTNTAADWAQDPADNINGRKIQYPGWDLDEFFQTTKVTETASLVVAVTPDNAYELIRSYVLSATSSILIEGYTFENADLIDAVVAASQRGVTVAMLLEGEEITDQERWFCQRLDAAGGHAYFLHSDAAAGIHDRYRYQHAKFMILDGRTLIVGSENFNYSSLPPDDKSNGTWGRRGVFLITDAPSVVARAQTIFHRDLDTAHQDIVAWSPSDPRYGSPPPGFIPTYVYTDYITYTVRFSQPLILSGTFPFEVVQSPENDLHDSDSLLAIVKRAGAGDVVLVEQLYENVHWGPTASTPATDPNPRLEAYIAAARRGATVRILLNGSLDAGSVGDNAITRDYINSIALNDGLNLATRLGDPAGRGIHNKMVLVWAGGQGFVHVGSINGSELSCKGNRELALQVQSDAAYDYLARLFTVDWSLAGRIYLPLVMRGYSPPPPPVNHVVISEVMYRPGGQSTGNREWVELYNPTDFSVDLTNWILGDAAAPGDFGAGLYRFPTGTTLPPRGVIVVAQQAADFQGVGGFTKPTFEFLIDPYRDDPTVPNMVPAGSWQGFGFALGDAGDKVILRNASGADVDVVVYGTASYPGVTPHPGGVDYNWSLERRPPDHDTNNCAVDFVPRYPATPGTVPTSLR